MGNINGENVSAQQESVAKTVWDYLGSQGFNEVSRAAILGNMWQESRMRPDAMQNGPVSASSTKGGYAYGLIQWDGGRRSNLLKQLGSNWSNVNSQLEFLMSEFNGPEKNCFNRGGVYSSINDFKNATELSTATNQFCTCFERAGTPHMSARISAAEYFFKTFTGTSPTDNNEQSTTSDGISGSVGAKKRAEEGVKNRTFQSYFESGFLDFGDNNDLTAAMFDELVKLDDGRRIAPISRLDNIEYGDRCYESMYNLTLGDCTFVIPPEFISIAEESNTQSLVTLRQENTQKIKNGYSRRMIVLDVVFHGVNQINGFKVPGPEGWYYVDGLRQLLAEFKCTPFLPITNWTINYTYNIWTVALQSIIISTLPGYPDVLTAHITLQEVDLFPYLESHTMFFEDFIDWDLFRFYYQRQLTESNEYGKLQSIPQLSANNKFKMSILNSRVFDSNIDYTAESSGDNVDFYDIIFDRKIIVENEDGTISVKNPSEEHSTNFIPYLDSEEQNLQIFEFHTGYSNIITNIQMAEMAHPTVQYMGGMDTNFQIAFETTSEDVIQSLQFLTSQNNTLIRDNRDYTGVGFVKIESELVQFTGTTFVMIDSITTSTVPGFPGLYTVQINCLSFDAYQKESEGIKGHSPFFVDDDPNKKKIGDTKSRKKIDADHPNDGKGFKSDAIKQSIDGLNNKIQQDLCLEQKMREDCNLFPDLKLPTYAEVDEVIQKIITFRNSNTMFDGTPLTPYPLQHYPRTPQRALHGINTVSGMKVNDHGFVKNIGDVIDSAPRYDLYVDPDFYVFYPETYKQLITETKSDLEEAGVDYVPTQPEARQSTYTSIYTPNSGSTDSDVSTGSSSVSNFLDTLKEKLGCPYVWGAEGPNSFDCTGFVVWGMNQCGINIPRFTTATLSNYVPKYFTLKATGSPSVLSAKASPGDMLYRPPAGGKCGHVGIYVGNGVYIHAPQTGDVVKYSNVVNSTFSQLYSINGIASSGAGEEIDDNDDNVTYSGETTVGLTYTINMSASIGDSGDNVKQLQKILNHVMDAGLETDGIYGTLTEQAVKDFQSWYNTNYSKNIKVDGKVGQETSDALEDVLNNRPKNSYVETETTTSDNYQITEGQLQNIAKTIANMQFGKPESALYGMAQMIYDRATDPNSKYGTINTIISSQLFNGMTSKDITQSQAYSCVKSVFCNGNRIFPTRCINYNGTEASTKNLNGLDELATYGEFTFYGDGKESSTKNFTIVDTITTTNTVTTTTTVQNGVEAVNASWVKQFGRPVVVKTSEMTGDDSGFIWNLYKSFFGTLEALIKGNVEFSLTEGIEVDYSDNDVFTVYESRYGKNNYNSDKNILLSSFCNQAEYSGKGRLVKAFPTYTFTIIDEDGNWLDGRKLWANCYFLRSLVEIQSSAFDDSPIHTATITVTNSYGNLSTRSPNDYYYTIQGKNYDDKKYYDEEYNLIQRGLYENFGILPSIVGPKLTEDLVERKNILYNSMIIRAGCRCQLRMGYGSDPLSLPIVLNGYISDISVGDIMTFVCVSDGVELTNAVISDSPKDMNGIFESQESSNMCIDILAKRGNILNVVVAEWGEASKYGIEHFGLYFTKHWDIFDTVNLGNGLWDIPDAVINFVAGTIELEATIRRSLGAGIGKGSKATQYDLSKNIYRANYKGSLAMYTPFWGFADGEKNICFSQYNKTPWDVVQISAQNAPEYLGYPMYHQFESRLFLGLPYWLAKYRYNMINGELYEEAKAFSQVHFVDSLTDIIDNQMKCTGRNVFTNAIVMYTLGKSPKATPTLYSDRSMNASRQSTKIYDSSVTQNIIGPDALWEFLGVEQGKSGAIRLGLSQLLINWAKAYKGDIMLLGDAGIYPNDYIYMNDRFNRINGMCTARCVTHTLSCNTGFVTTFTPGMIGFSNLQNSQGHITITNLSTIGAAFSYFSSIKKIVKDNSEKVATQYCVCKVFAGIAKIAQIKVKAFIFGLGYNFFNKVVGALSNKEKVDAVIKSFKTLKFADTIKDIKNAGSKIRESIKFVQPVQYVKDIKKLADKGDIIVDIGKIGFKGVGSAVGELVTPIPIIDALIGFTLGSIVDILLEKVIEHFMYKHCINLLPMMRDNMCYTPHWGQNLLLNYNEDPDTSPYGEKDKEYSNGYHDIEDVTSHDSGEYTISGSDDPDSDNYDKVTFDID